ncbi:MAG: Amuc_1102 family pilus-like protein [Akkermansiaceae bacterium]
MVTTRNSIQSLTLAFLVLGFAASLFAQEMPVRSKTKEVKASDPKFNELQSPDVNVGGAAKKFRPKNWLEIEVELGVGKWNPKLADGYVDNLTVKWWVVVKGQDRKTYLMEKTVEHVNVPEDEEVVVSIYISPNTLKRITGKDSAGKGDIEAVGGEIQEGGEMLGFFNHGNKKGWWRQPLDSVERTGKFPLLNKDETPFKFLWYDRYAEIRPKNN